MEYELFRKQKLENETKRRLETEKNRGGNQYRASQNIDVTDPKDPEGNPKRIPRGPKKQNHCLKTIHMRRKSNNEADNICCPISISCHTYVIWPFYKCAGQIHSTPVKNIFFLFFIFYANLQTWYFCGTQTFTFSKISQFNWCVKIKFNFPLKF